MDEKDRQFIEALLAKHTEQLDQRLDGLSKDLTETRIGFAKEMEETRIGFAASLKETQSGLVQVIEAAERRLAVLIERVDHKLDVVIEGQEMHAEISERADLELKEDLGKEDRRVTAVASDLAVHKADPLAHHKVYGVKEEDEEFGK